MWLTIGLIVGGIVAVAFGILVVIGLRMQKEMRRMIEEGDHAVGWLVQANVALFEKGDDDNPALVLISPDERTERNEQLMTHLAERIMELKGVDPDDCEDDDEALVAEWMSDETYEQGRRDKLPKRFARGHTVYLAHIWIDREHLPGKRLHGREVPCALMWDEPGTVICTRPVKRKKKKSVRWEDED